MIIKDREVIKWVMQKAKKMSDNDKLEVYTMKEDRGFKLIKQSDNFQIEEFGYENKQYEIKDIKDLKKQLKVVHKIEFPRSTNVKVKI